MPNRTQHAFIVVVDPTDADANLSDVRKFITTSPDIANWWNYIPGTYIVSTSLSADELSDRLKLMTGDVRHLVVRTDLKESEGWLPERAWKWIRRRSREEDKKTVAN